MGSKTARIAALSAAAAVAVAGCGGGETHKPATLTKAQVIARGSVICKAAERRAEQLKAPATDHPFAKGTSAAEQRQAREWLRGYAAALESSRVGLQKLQAPAPGRNLLRGYLRDTGKVVADLRTASGAPAGEVERDAMAAFQLFERASKQTAAYGFPKGVCGAGSSS